MKNFQDLLMEHCEQAVGLAIFTEKDHVLWWNEERRCFIVSESGTVVYGGLPLATAKAWGVPMGTLPLDGEIWRKEKEERGMYEDICARLNLAR